MCLPIPLFTPTHSLQIPKTFSFYFVSPRLFAIDALNGARYNDNPPILQVGNAKFGPNRRLPPKGCHTTSRLLMQSHIFMGLVVRHNPNNKCTLFNRRRDNVFSIRTIYFSKLILTPRVNRFEGGYNRLINSSFTRLHKNNCSG